VRETLLLATRSADKTREIRVILGAAGIEIRTLDDLGVKEAPAEDEIEAFDTFRENALAKARWFHRRCGLPTIADDSGICADALGGRPGVRSRRFSGRSDLDGLALDLANNHALAAALAELDAAAQSVRYVCAAVLVEEERSHICSLGTVRGSFLTKPRGSGGFGYDPHFLIDGAGCTFAELDRAGKHRLSHRGRAFRALSVALH
jgi:XTP/dITP diphosphohydrolase